MVMSDVVEEILSRLLVKDLLRFKSVCKSWHSLISSPSFVNTHCKFMCNEEEDSRRKIAMITSYKEYGCHEYQIPQEWRFYDRWNMGGSCNGLVCIYTSYEEIRIIITNPLTREFVELAKPPELPEDDWYEPCLGFGYDSSTDDYKVVMAICRGSDRALVHILSLKSNIWKLFGHVNYEFDDDLSLKMPGILFNGALHWFWNNPNDTKGENILLVSFDLAKEEFREIPQPDDTKYVWNDYYSLGIMEGRLCIHLGFDDDEDFNFPSCGTWVMKNYNVKPSWELLPKDCEMKDHAIHYMLKDTIQSKIMPTYFCDENIQLSRSKEHIGSPMFVQTLVSPYINNGRSSHSKNNKINAIAGSVQEKREIEEVYSMEDKKRKRLL